MHSRIFAWKNIFFRKSEARFLKGVSSSSTAVSSSCDCKWHNFSTLSSIRQNLSQKWKQQQQHDLDVLRRFSVPNVLYAVIRYTWGPPVQRAWSSSFSYCVAELPGSDVGRLSFVFLIERRVSLVEFDAIFGVDEWRDYVGDGYRWRTVRGQTWIGRR